jgi:hypothetical protein
MTVTVRVRTVVWLATTVVVSVFCTLLVSQEWRAAAAPGDIDSTFVPITPCRLFDFRPGESPAGPKKTPLGAGAASAYTQQVTGAVGNCSVPSDAVAVAMNVTIANPTAQSNLRLFPANATAPLVSNLNWRVGAGATPNKVDVKLSPDGKVKLQNLNGTVDVIGDVVGYYTKSSLENLIPHGEIVMRHSTTDLTPNAGDPAAVQNWAQGAFITSAGVVNVRLDGPAVLGGVQYGLKSIAYCVEVTTLLHVTSIVVYGTAPSSFTIDDTDRKATGCYTVAVNKAQGFAFDLVIVTDGTGQMRVSGVRSTWAPASTMPAAASSSHDVGEPDPLTGP